MDLDATQIYEEESSQRISDIPEEDSAVQIGTLTVNECEIENEYEIKKGTTKIGRHKLCDIFLKDLLVSKTHAEIEACGASTWICDLNSANKTKLNDLILKPNRSYELKDGSIIKFGRVSAVYRKRHSTNDMFIPETPALARQKGTNTIIPNTPDSSFNNSSAVDTDGSIIFGTQRDEETNIFRRPLIPQQRQSNISKQNSSIVSCNDESSDSQIMLRTSDTNVDENRETNIFDMETQNFEKGHSMVSDSIYDKETQKFSTDASKHLVETNTKASKQFSRSDMKNKITSSSATDIHDLETQNYISDISELETQRNEENIENVTAKKRTTNIYDIETQNCISDSGKGDIEVQEFKNDKNKSREGNLDQIDDLETQKLNNKRIAEDISDMETQLELDGTTSATNDISDLETQLIPNDVFNNKQADKDNAVNTKATKAGISYENMESSKSNSSSPRSLYLSSPGIDEDAPSSSLNQSGHLLESSDLLEYFSEGIDKSDEMQACNAVSTPKSRAKASSETENNSRNRSNTSDNKDEDDVENIFDAPTQLVNLKFEASTSKDTDKEDPCVMRLHITLPEKRGTSRSKQTDDDSETDAEEYVEELATKECKSWEISNNESAGKRNDLGTSIESEDMFDVPTQRFSDRVINYTSNSSINRSSKMDETNIVVNNTTNDQDNATDIASVDIDDMKLILRIASNSPSKSNQNDMDDMAPTQIINANIDVSKSINASENLDQEDIDYEMAPTQVIGEEQRNSKREKAGESSNVNLSDTIEQNLNEMFDDICTENIHESQQMSTQNLEKILESSASDNDLSIAVTDNVPQTRLRKKKHASHSQSPCNSSGIKTNADNNVDTDSQNSDINFFITTRRKRNVIRDTQELVESAEDTSSKNVNSSQMSKADEIEKIEDNSVATRSSKRGKKLSKSKNKSATDPTLNDDDTSGTSETKKTNLVNNATNDQDNATDIASVDIHDMKLILPIASNSPSKSNHRRTRSMKPSDEATSEQVLEKDSSKVAVDDTGKDSTTKSNIYAPCLLTKDIVHGQGVEISNALFENDDDILLRLPVVRISGTLSNPGSPSASSTSTVRTVRSKQSATKNRNKKNKSKKSLRKQSVENSKKDKDLNEMKDEPSVPLLENYSSSLETRKSKILSPDPDSSEDSDSDLDIRLKQVAERILTKQLSYQKSRNKRSIQNTSDSVVPDKKRNMRTSNVSEAPKQNADAESTNPPRVSLRLTRQNNESSRASQEEDSAESIAAKFMKSETNSLVKRKRDLNALEENVEDINLKKRKADQVIKESAVSTRSRKSVMKTTDKQFSNIVESAKSDSRGNSPVIENTKASEDSQAVSKAAAVESQKVALNPKTDENADSKRFNVKRTRRKINEDHATASTSATADENSNKNKQIQTKEEKTKSLIQGKDLKIVLSPINCSMISFARDESQEVEMIMGTMLSNVHDKNLSIRENSNAKIFKKESRIGRRKRANADINTDSTESSVSSDVGDSDNTQSDNCAPKVKRERPTKNSAPSRTRAQVSEKKEIFKRPTRANWTSILDSSMESTTDGDSLSSSRSDASSSSRASRSRTMGARKEEKIEIHQNTRSSSDNSQATSSRMNMSLETTSPASTSSRTRRSSSISSNLTPTSTRHRILFTGIMEDYSKIVKTLGGIKVEEPAKCSVLVTDKVRRTYKFLCALAQGIPVVSIDWLKDSESAARFLDWESYILKDPAAEARFGFRLRKSLEKAKEKKLLDGYTVVLTPGVAPPPVQELKDMVTSSGGNALLRPPTKWPERTVIISREEDLSNARKFLAKAPNTVTIQSTEFILTGILRQETDFGKFKLT